MPEGNFLVRARLVAPSIQKRINHQPSECNPLDDTQVVRRCRECGMLLDEVAAYCSSICQMRYEERLVADARPAMDCGVALEAGERAMNSDRPVGEVPGCTCGLCRSDWSE